MRQPLLIAASFALFGSACTSPTNGGIVCTDIFVPGITVAPVDSMTGTPVSGATAVARDGAFVDSTSQLGMIAGERAGTYSVTVRKTGYAVGTRNSVKVTRDECHVKTVSLTAKLQPLP